MSPNETEITSTTWLSTSPGVIFPVRSWLTLGYLRGLRARTLGSPDQRMVLALTSRRLRHGPTLTGRTVRFRVITGISPQNEAP